MIRDDEEMAGVGSATNLHSAADAAPAGLWLAGGVEPVLQSTCEWAPGGSSGATGVIRTVDLSTDGLRFGLGAGAFGTPPERAIQSLGEYLLVEGRSWWTPAAAPTLSRSEPPDSVLLTPFLLRWDHIRSAGATLRSPRPVPLARWYGYLLHRLAGLGMCRTGIIAVEIVADVPAGLIADKHLIRAPLRELRPRDGQLIIAEKHLDEYFLCDVVARAHGDDMWCTAVMAGVVAAPALMTAAWADEFLRRSFYVMPDAVGTSAVAHHTHALVMPRLPAAKAGGDQAGTHGERLRPVPLERASGTRPVQAVHIEDDTFLLHADARIGVVDAVTMD